MTDNRVTPLTERSLPWGILGRTFNSDAGIGTAEMLSSAGLADWDIALEPVPLPEGYWNDKPEFWITKRSGVNPEGRDILGTHSKRYNALSNEELFDFGDGLLDGGSWVSAGSFKGGRVVFGTLKLDHKGSVNGSQMDPYLLVSTSHDGSLAVQASTTMINPWCLNTLIAAIKGASQKFKIRHTQTLQGRMIAAREALGLSATYVDLWSEFMTPLADTEVTDERFDEIINKAFAPAEDASKSAVTRWDKTYEDLIDIWYGETVKDTPFANTQFGVWNALNEHHGWAMSGRGDNKVENVAAARSGFSPVWNAENDRLLAIARSA